jgi:hypothetical protein
VQDWEVGVIAAVDTPEHRAGYRWFVTPTLFREPIAYTETREQAQRIVTELRHQRDHADAGTVL